MSSPTPDEIFENWKGMQNNDFQATIRKTFNLPEEDDYIYAAESLQMTLAELDEEMKTGKYNWCYRSYNHTIEPVSEADIITYVNIFAPRTDTSQALKFFSANSQKISPRSMIATSLISRRLLPSSLRTSKSKDVHVNPYFDIWAWSCFETGSIGPLNDDFYASPWHEKYTHPILPVLFHHFGHVCPTFEAISIISKLCAEVEAEGVLDMSSGNGYWSYMLRCLGIKSIAVDNNIEAKRRYMWIPDAIKADGATCLRSNDGAKSYVLLMVYMATKGDSTKIILQSYEGDRIAVAGTQNNNNFKGHSDIGAEEYFKVEMKGWKLSARVALPSFVGKDDELFVFSRIQPVCTMT